MIGSPALFGYEYNQNPKTKKILQHGKPTCTGLTFSFLLFFFKLVIWYWNFLLRGLGRFLCMNSSVQRSKNVV